MKNLSRYDCYRNADLRDVPYLLRRMPAPLININRGFFNAADDSHVTASVFTLIGNHLSIESPNAKV